MKITIYELLGMIKDGKAPKKIEFDTEKYLWCEKQEEYRRYPYENNLYYSLWSDYDLTKCLNEEVKILEILEEEKKIPKKLPYYSMEKIQKAKNKDEWLDERITLLERRVNDLHIKMNDLLDYLKSKGE